MEGCDFVRINDLMKWNTEEREENMQSTGNETICETSTQNLQQPSTLENRKI